VCELEMEFIEGQFADIMTLVPYLRLGPELSWPARSKGGRCHALAFDLQPAATHARSVRSPRMGVVKGCDRLTYATSKDLPSQVEEISDVRKLTTIASRSPSRAGTNRYFQDFQLCVYISDFYFPISAAGVTK